MGVSSSGRRFPCPVCAVPQEVRSSKKDKPYITCNGCGGQVFVRGREGVQEFKKLLEQADLDGTLERMNGDLFLTRVE